MTTGELERTLMSQSYVWVSDIWVSPDMWAHPSTMRTWLETAAPPWNAKVDTVQIGGWHFMARNPEHGIQLLVFGVAQMDEQSVQH